MASDKMKFDAGALLMAAGFGVVGGFMAAPHPWYWLFGLGIAVLVYATVVLVDARGTREPPPPPQRNEWPESSNELWLRAQHAGAKVPAADSLMKVLNNHLLTIVRAQGSNGDHAVLIARLRNDMESATKLLERAANEPRLDPTWLAEELQRMCDNLERNERDAREALGD